MKLLLICSVVLLGFINEGLCIKCYVSIPGMNTTLQETEGGAVQGIVGGMAQKMGIDMKPASGNTDDAPKFKTCTKLTTTEGDKKSVIFAGLVDETEVTGCYQRKMETCACNTDACNTAVTSGTVLLSLLILPLLIAKYI